MILLSVSKTDTEEDARLLAAKIVKLRIFSDDAGKMNLSVKDTGGDALVISNFTLMADYRHGNRPDYLRSAPPERARELYEYFISLLGTELGHVGTGKFGAHMEIDITCDGPVTIVMDSDVLKTPGGKLVE
jgi:D-tyrosyl-tRNA(Tyr) deacylase